jgi:hypothetical protein
MRCKELDSAETEEVMHNLEFPGLDCLEKEGSRGAQYSE